MSELVRDGVRLWYAQAGRGDPPLVLVHGWCGDHTFLAPQFDHFARNHRVIATDLRGHGKSDKPVQDYTVAGFADDLVWLAEQLELSPIVVIGHSLGAIVALEAAGKRPDLIAGAVLIDPAPIVRPPGLDEVARDFINALQGPNYKGAARQHIEQVLFAPGDDPGLRTRIAGAMCQTPQHVMASVMAQIFAWDGEAALARCDIPALIISSTTTFNDVARCRELCASISTTSVKSSHFAQLLVPEGVDAAIESFLADMAAVSDAGDGQAGRVQR